MIRLLPAVTGFVAAASLICATIAPARADTEEPRHTVVAKIGAIEIRQYGPRLAADVIMQGDEEDAQSDGFRALADYIFGNNTARSKIAMTAPVAQERSEKVAMTAPVAQTREGGAWRVRFFMPSKYTRETLPQPNNQAVQIVEVPGETMAVLRFSNSRSAEAVAIQTAALLRGLEGSRWTAAGAPVTWLYDPPWTLPFFRRNEVAVAVKAR
ncbi:MAG: heme-binding protein [Alphaproteobacteria bacterium]|nr:heme-binding protein [Alphaproteobacteria bacterium]